MTSAVDDVTGEAQAPPERRRRRESLAAWAWSLVRLDFVGVAFGALFFCLSLTPSLLPQQLRLKRQQIYQAIPQLLLQQQFLFPELLSQRQLLLMHRQVHRQHRQ